VDAAVAASVDKVLVLGTLASMSTSAHHLVQMFVSTIARTHVAAAGTKGGSKAHREEARARGIVTIIPFKSNEKNRPKVSAKPLYKSRRFKRVHTA
jgi:hypothetical protein